jgi:thiol-disulfide isomerase/thioredoxin
VSSFDTTAYFDRRSDFFRRAFETGLAYDSYVATGTESHQRRWHDMLDQVLLRDVQQEFLRTFTRRTHVLVLSGTWCGDCIRQVPILRRIEEASPAVVVRILDRDRNPEVRDELRLSGAAKVPVAVFLNEDFFECSRFGDRTLATYRALGQAKLGPACPIGPAELAPDELEANIGAWIAEVERVQLLLRLTPYLRQRHGD